MFVRSVDSLLKILVGLLVARWEMCVAVLSLSLEMGSLRVFELLGMLPKSLPPVCTDRRALLDLPMLVFELRQVRMSLTDPLSSMIASLLQVALVACCAGKMSVTITSWEAPVSFDCTMRIMLLMLSVRHSRMSIAVPITLFQHSAVFVSEGVEMGLRRLDCRKRGQTLGKVEFLSSLAYVVGELEHVQRYPRFVSPRAARDGRRA